MRELDEVLLKQKLNEIFVKKEINIENPNCMAALITAASKMATYSNRIDEFTTIDELVDLYMASEETKQLIGMAPQYVKANIGYSIDFNDFNVAENAYRSEKNAYNELYYRIAKRNQERNCGKQI